MLITGLVLFLLQAPGTVCAQNSEEVSDQDHEAVNVDELLVTARGVESQVSQTPGGTAAMDAQQLYQAQDPSITNTLTRIPGVDKSSDSAWGSAINIRGLGRNHVVFLIDGCRVNTATDVNAQFGLINSYEVERIEILKGPVSALYGSGAMGGVVNVITKKGYFSDETTSETSLGASFGTNPEGFSLFGDTRVNTPDFWIYGAASRRDYDSYENGDGDTQANSQFEDYSGSLKAGYKWNEKNITDINIQYMKGEDIGIPGKGLSLPTGPTITYPDTDRTLVSLTHKFTPEDSILTASDLNLFYQEIDRNVEMVFPAGSAATSINPSANHKSFGGKWQNVIGLASQTIVTGLDVWTWEIESTREKNLASGLTGIDTPLADAKQLSAGLFLEDDIQIGQPFVLNLGGRVDYISAKSDPLYNWITPPSARIPVTLIRDGEDNDDVSWDAHAGLTWDISSPWSMTLLGAFSYRAPDLMDRYKYVAFTGGATYGNPDLDPERSSFIEYGIHYRTPKISFSGSVYANYLKDMIASRLKDAATNTYQMENIDKARLYGGELEAKYRPVEKWEIYAGIAYVRGTDETDDSNLSMIPPLNGIAGVSFAQGDKGFWADCNLTWADRQDKVASGEQETAGWATVNAKAGYKFDCGRFGHDIMMGVDNIFDAQYANHLSTTRSVLLAEPGVNIYAAYRVTF